MFTKIETELSGLVVLQPRIFEDQRGTFIKTFNADLFCNLGLDFEPREEFYSVSAKNVLRGMHFQVPPAAHTKLAYCLAGRVLDVVVDLRRSSHSYRRWHARELNSINRELLFIPVGFAHGFLALEDNSTMVYQTSTGHAPAQDAGLRWDSFGYQWPTATPIISKRDAEFPGLKDFDPPFA